MAEGLDYLSTKHCQNPLSPLLSHPWSTIDTYMLL